MYRVKTVAERIGVPRATLLAWERRYGLVAPARSPSGYREYSEADVAVLAHIKELVDAGHPVSEAVGLARAPAPGRAVEGLADAFLDRLLAFDRAGADALAPRLALLPFELVVDEVYMPALRAVGDRWADGRATVAQEHFVASVCREHLLALLRGLGGGPRQGPVAVCATAPGEAHDLGLLGVAVRLALDGMRVVWLGADLPIPALASAADAASAALVAVSVLAPRPAREVLALGRAVRAAARAPSVAVGGPAAAGLEDEPGLWFAPDYAGLRRRLEGA